MPIPMLIRGDEGPPEPQPPPGRPPWEPNWRVWRWLVAAGIVGFAASHASAGLASVLVLVVFALCCRALADAIPYGDGLREWRQ